MGVPEVRGGGREMVQTGQGRPLGLRVQPTMWLSMGYRDENRRGAPVKTDHFRVRESSEPIAAQKFIEQFGPEPKEIPIMLPGRLEDALEIKYRAWSGGGGGSPGRLKAIGQTNMALTGFVEGPDVLLVWGDKPEPEELPIEGLDDPVAQGLKLELSMKFVFTIPSVLGMGEYCAIASKGKQSIDTLWLKLRDLYGLFGESVTLAVRPVLWLRPAHSQRWNEQRSQWERTEYYALDLKAPDTIDEMLERKREADALLAGTGSAPPLLSSGPGGPLPPFSGPPEREDAEPPEVVGEAEVEVQPPAGGAPTLSFARLKLALDTLEGGGETPELVDTTTGEVREFADWQAYALAWCQDRWDVHTATDLNAQQLDQLCEHLEQQDIPF